MESYTVTELAKLFQVTRKTIYAKMEHEVINKYTLTTEQGKRLSAEGLPYLKELLVNSKVNTEGTQSKQPDYTELYIRSLLDQIDFLKDQLQACQEINRQLLVQLQNTQQLLLPEKAGFFKKIFRK